MPGLQIGIDLGSSCITAYAAGKGIVLHEANAISFDAFSGDVVAVGNEAMAMTDRTPSSLRLCRPMQSGVISDFSIQCEILRRVLDRVCKNAVLRPNLIISVPSDLTKLQQRTILDAAIACGAARVSLLPGPVAAAFGAGVSIEEPRGVLVVDIGAGTTDIAVMTMGTVAYCKSLPLAGDDFDNDIVRYLRRTAGVEIGLPTAKRLKHQIGCVTLREEEFEAAANGKDTLRQMPLQCAVTSTQICEALGEDAEKIADAVLSVLEEVPPELFADICGSGLILCGGSSKLYGLDTVLHEKLRLPVTVAPDGEHCAAKGAGYALRQMKQLEDHGLQFRVRERGLE